MVLGLVAQSKDYSWDEGIERTNTRLKVQWINFQENVQDLMWRRHKADWLIERM